MDVKDSRGKGIVPYSTYCRDQIRRGKIAALGARNWSVLAYSFVK
jgi:hypothetical protein